MLDVKTYAVKNVGIRHRGTVFDAMNASVITVCDIEQQIRIIQIQIKTNFYIDKC